MATSRQVPVKNKYAPDFKRFYATGAIGGFNRYDFRIAFYNVSVVQPEDSSIPPSGTREILAEVILSPLAAKQLRDLLDKNVKQAEKLVGEIKSAAVPESAGDSSQGAQPYG